MAPQYVQGGGRHWCQNPKDNGSIPFLDTLVSPACKNTLTTSVYRKPTHADQYLHCESQHGLSARYSVFNTLTPKNTLTTSVYRKPTHADQYLHCESQHGLSARYSVFNTLTPRFMCTNQQILKKEEDHIRKVLLRCN